MVPAEAVSVPEIFAPYAVNTPDWILTYLVLEAYCRIPLVAACIGQMEKMILVNCEKAAVF